MCIQISNYIADPSAFCFEADPDPTFHSDADPDSTFHFDVDPAPHESDANLPPLAYRPFAALRLHVEP